jgi:hypothetical protein
MPARRTQNSVWWPGDTGLRGSNIMQQTSEESLIVKVPVRKRESVAFDREPGVVLSP